MKSSILLRILILIALVVGLHFTFPAHPAFASALDVDTLVDENDGSCVDGDCSLRDALAVANSGDTITFKVTGTIILGGTDLVINQNLTITGPGSALLTVDGNNQSRVFRLNSGKTVSISGMTMTHGYADPNTTCGGGAINNDAALSMDDVVITNNSAPAGNPLICSYPRGGAITVFNSTGSLTITNSTISNNSTFWDGGGIYFNSSSGTLSLTNVIVDNNHSTDSNGGGIYIENGNAAATLNHVTFSNNAADTGIGGGGGLYTRVDVSITNSTFSGNSAADDGGGIYSYNSSTSINSSTINGNFTTGSSNSDGGGIINIGNADTSALTITNSTLSGNNAAHGSGGAIDNIGSGNLSTSIATTTIINSTIVGNNASQSGLGGGIFAVTATAQETSTVTLSNSIVYGNTITTGTNGENCSRQNNATIVTNNHNLFQSLANDCAAGATDITNSGIVSTIVNPLANNGGLTQTLSLPAGSPAIDAGDNAICSAVPVSNTSQNGNSRPQGSLCDIGSYELDYTAPTVDTFTATTPSTLTIPITAFTASDNVGVTGYLITTSATPPAPGAAGWTGTAPTTFSVGGEGSYTLYPWAKDATGNVSAVFGTPRTVIVDTTAPSVLSSIRANTNPTSAASVDFTVTFSESVTGVDASDFNLTTSGVSGAAVSGVSGSGSVYTVTVNTGSGNGNIRLDLVNDNSIKDAALNPLAAGFISGETYIVNKSPIFADVPYSYWANSFIERLYNAGITGGCSASPLNYCPDSTVTRAQMAVFLLKGMHGSNYTPPTVGVSTGFADVPTNYWAAAWIKQLASEGITGGCGSGIYCPDNTVTRAQMAVFLLKAKHGSAYTPPPATGIFTDVPVGYWADKWIEQLASEGITGGCGTGIYCPDSSVTRAQMAVFLVKAFNLP